MTDSPTNMMGWKGKIARVTVLLLSLYWGLFALLSPVTVWDAHVYNLGRLPLAERFGLWHNPYWTSERQLAFPWTFDAIHWPLLHLGFGYGLPSFLCFAGILSVAWNTLRRWHHEEAAWIGTLALLALPTLVFQAVGTKNDVAVLFGVAVWWHALQAWQRLRRPRYLWLASLAIGFTAGAKSSGLIFALLESGFTLWALRRNLPAWRSVAIATAISLLSLGSVETYVATANQYGHALGREAFVREHRNNDGVRGALANAVRYALANVSSGLEPWLKIDPVCPRLEVACQSILKATGLEHVGYRKDYDNTRLVFIKNGWDAGSDFGPIGTLCVALALLAFFWWRPREPWWQLSTFAFVSLGAISYTVAWMPWNARFLVIPFAILTVALISLAAQRQWKGAGTLLLIVSFFSALSYPLGSFNKRPADLRDAIMHRENSEFKERATLLPIIAAIRDWRTVHPGGEVLLLAGSDSWVLTFLSSSQLAVRPVLSTELAGILDQKLASHAPAVVLALNRPDFDSTGLPLMESRTFPNEPGTVLYIVARPEDQPAAPRATWRTGYFQDGWTGANATLELVNWSAGKVTLQLNNALPFRREVELSSQGSHESLVLEAGESRLVSIAVTSKDTVSLIVRPGIVPQSTNLGPDTRELGLNVRLSNWANHGESH